ncbi:MAG: KUP/HAK/KT family potassium transporter, partial [Caulobacteraceae bacterium]
FPCLAINYLGQAAYALEVIAASGGRPAGDVDWFFTMAPPMMRAPMVVLSTIATIIASQAVITGAYSISNQAMQLGLLPRMTVKNTSESHSGQIYLPRVNLFLLIGVVLLIGIFKTSEALAHAYGIAVTGTMVITTLLAFMVTRSLWKWPLWKSLLVVGPLLTIDCIFLGANALKILSGGFVPLVIGFGLLTLMWAWMRGQRQLSEDATSDRPPLCDLLAMLERQPPAIVAGTAVFLVDNPDRAPGALLHNLKHNHILHERNLIVTVRSDDVPFVGAADRISLKRLSERFTEVTLTYGFMQSPNVPRALSEARKAGLALDMASTSYFLGRRTVLCAGHGKLPRWLAALFVLLHRNAAAPTDYFHLPPGRVVELGTQAGV